MTHNSATDLPALNRNDVMRHWDNPTSWKLWQTVGDTDLVSLGWKAGQLHVSAGGHTLDSSMAPQGMASSSEKWQGSELAGWQAADHIVIDTEQPQNHRLEREEHRSGHFADYHADEERFALPVESIRPPSLSGAVS